LGQQRQVRRQAPSIGSTSNLAQQERSQLLAPDSIAGSEKYIGVNVRIDFSAREGRRFRQRQRKQDAALAPIFEARAHHFGRQLGVVDPML